MEAEATDIVDTKIELVGLDLARSQGIEVATGAAIDRLRANGVQGIWVHVDVDVLDSDLMPAVDSPAPGGLSFEELEGFLRVVRAAPLIVGLELTVFDPDLDSEGVLARRLVDSVVAGLA